MRDEDKITLEKQNILIKPPHFNLVITQITQSCLYQHSLPVFQTPPHTDIFAMPHIEIASRITLSRFLAPQGVRTRSTERCHGIPDISASRASESRSDFPIRLSVVKCQTRRVLNLQNASTPYIVVYLPGYSTIICISSPLQPCHLQGHPQYAAVHSPLNPWQLFSLHPFKPSHSYVQGHPSYFPSVQNAIFLIGSLRPTQTLS
jgi:hypothetical protein